MGTGPGLARDLLHFVITVWPNHMSPSMFSNGLGAPGPTSSTQGEYQKYDIFIIYEISALPPDSPYTPHLNARQTMSVSLFVTCDLSALLQCLFIQRIIVNWIECEERCEDVWGEFLYAVDSLSGSDPILLRFPSITINCSHLGRALSILFWYLHELTLISLLGVQ